MLALFVVFDVVTDTKKVNLVLNVPDKFDELAGSFGFDEGLAPHSFHVAHSLLVEQELEHGGVFDALI